MDASDSEISSVTSRFVLLVSGLTIMSALFITTLAVNHELHDPTGTGKMIFFACWVMWVILYYKADGKNHDNTESVNIKKMKGKNYAYEDQFGFKLQFW